ncbi:MAG: hypothetical protein OEV42_09945 [Deltaproteobacteria bacterium]|nr:hypothetical protein [Deltaproteobacteria bacterium]
MKDVIKIIIAIVVTSLLWLVAMQDANYNNLRRNEKEVWIPTLVIINDLKITSNRGEREILDQKLKLFEKNWRSYSQGGDKPLVFYEEIIKIGKDLEKKKP